MGPSIRVDLISRVGGGLLTGLLATVRSELVHGHEIEETIVRPGIPAIYVLWHGRLLPCAYHYRHLGLGTVISRNRDGDYISGMIQRWGFHVIRGSSSRGAVGAQLAIVRALEEGRSVALTPDGPRGPRQKMKLGPLRAAQKAAVPLVPVAGAAAAGWYFGRWDRFLVPKPFTRAAVGLGEPLYLPRTASPDDLARSAILLENRLNALTRAVDEAINPAG